MSRKLKIESVGGGLVATCVGSGGGVGEEQVNPEQKPVCGGGGGRGLSCLTSDEYKEAVLLNKWRPGQGT